jgi:hypothetical protein
LMLPDTWLPTCTSTTALTVPVAVTLACIGPRSAATLKGLTASVPMDVVCDPVPPNIFGPQGNGHLTMRQSRSNRVAVGAADISWILSAAARPLGGGGGGGGGPLPNLPITCDGATVNSYTVVVTPDFFFDPFTEALRSSPATTEFAAQICGFSYTGSTCDSIDTGAFSLRIGGGSGNQN